MRSSWLLPSRQGLCPERKPLPLVSPPRGQREHDALLRTLRALAPASESSVPPLISSAPTADVPSRYRARLRPALRESVQSSPRGHATTRDRTQSVGNRFLSHACKYAGLSRSLPRRRRVLYRVPAGSQAADAPAPRPGRLNG